MKLIIAFFLLLTIGCNQVENSKQGIENDQNNSTKDESPATIDTDLNGTWVLTNYLDSIEKNKTVAKYRMLPASWFGILLQIENDSLKAFGSIQDKEYFFNVGNPDSLCLLEAIGGKYQLSLNNKSGNLELKLIESFNDTKDTVKYILRKRDDLKYLTNSTSNLPHKTSDNFTRYFNNLLIAGDYIWNDAKKINFSKESIVRNFKDYYSYEVRNYFGTLHPFQEMDVLILQTKKNVTDFWNWEIENDNLILIKLKLNLNNDKWELTNEKIILKKV